MLLNFWNGEFDLFANDEKAATIHWSMDNIFPHLPPKVKLQPCACLKSLKSYFDSQGAVVAFTPKEVEVNL